MYAKIFVLSAGSPVREPLPCQERKSQRPPESLSGPVQLLLGDRKDLRVSKTLGVLFWGPDMRDPSVLGPCCFLKAPIWRGYRRGLNSCQDYGTMYS